MNDNIVSLTNYETAYFFIRIVFDLFLLFFIFLFYHIFKFFKTQTLYCYLSLLGDIDLSFVDLVFFLRNQYM